MDRKYLEIIWDFVSNISTFTWLIGVLIIIVPFFVYFWKYIKTQIRFGKNLRRKIYFLKTSALKDLQNEKDLISNLKTFNIDSDIKDISGNVHKVDNLENKSVYIVGYDENYGKYNELFEHARINKIPLIIYAKQGEIRKFEHWDLINNYIYGDIANTPNRIAVMTLNILKIL
ncbi:hypothetical protein CSB07_01190 [Candidatus Gracilibacteria bacterium]|nr:MAG: hypothetical protein CSB07_01190 [Candidatus Gracilibacteria bacterium]PIE85599.1 MAG: hypothetical protein CSA08_01155 [Candidatus Gracilibacteria bacterium]